MTGQEARDDEREAQGVAVEPIAFAVYGRSTGGLKYVSEWDEDDAREAAEFYDVVPLHRLESARKHPEPEITDAVRSHWQAIRGAQTDMLNGRPDMDALEEIALASAALDQLLGASGPWVPVGEGEQG